MSDSLQREESDEFFSLSPVSDKLLQAALEPKLSNANEALWLLGELAGELSTAIDLENLQSILSRRLRWIFDFDRCTFAVWPERSDTEYLILEVTSPSKAAKSTPQQKAAINEGWPGKVLVESKPYFLTNLTQLSATITPPTNPHWGIDLEACSLMLLPLRAGKRTIGSLNFSSSRPGTYSLTWLNLASLLATQVGGQLSSILAHQRATLALKNLELSQAQLRRAIKSREQIMVRLEEQMHELQKLNQLKDEFLSTVSHELRGPLANIKMAIHMLKVTSSAKRTEHYLQILEDECRREMNLVNDLLDLQRLEVGSKPFILEAIHVKDWLSSLVASFQTRLKQHQQLLQLDISHSLPLVSDRASLERILVELLNNACKYTPQGGRIRVCAQQFSNISTSLRTKFVVCNSGPEIPVEELNHIFEKFYRVRRGYPWEEEGTGLGLALVRKLVEHLDGTIAVSSQPEQTVFTVQIPSLSTDTHRGY